MKRITSLPPGHIFVFGSNLVGIHGKGAARDAAKYFGAVLGVGSGRTGQSYAIPTKHHWRDSAGMALPLIKMWVDEFLTYAKEEPSLTFHVTPIGCGYAGYTPKEIAPLFKDAPSNVILPEEFK